ncbi:MAG: hypothetical protein WCX88_01875 [Patescibacteria group bacterium]
MTLKRYLLLMFLATLLCWLALASVMFYINPSEAGIIGFVLFYISLFLSLVGTFSLAGFMLRVWLTTVPIFKQVIVSFRQGVLFSVFVSVSLAMQSQGMLTWWIVLLLLGILTAIEYIFSLSNRRV